MNPRYSILALFFLISGCDGGSISSEPDNSKFFSEVSDGVNRFVSHQEQIFSELKLVKNFVGFRIISRESSYIFGNAQLSIKGNGDELERKYSKVEVLTFSVQVFDGTRIITLRERGTMLYASENGLEAFISPDKSESFAILEYPEAGTSPRFMLIRSYLRDLKSTQYYGLAYGDEFVRKPRSISYSFSDISMTRVIDENHQDVFLEGFSGAGSIYFSTN